ncbi:unnamed protein product [Meloidogyne enterolobii]|uniref:Uncharacterized protein n=1 Tax=Meloidogyne enterolobii TaxID=390850 RepID=A0ACB1A1B3_MELEN
MQYQRRFGPYLINVLVAGIDLTSKKPFIAASDSVGGMSEFEDFVSVAFWRPDLTAEQLTEATAQVMLGVIERDAATGWGAIVYTVTQNGITSHALKCRLD